MSGSIVVKRPDTPLPGIIEGVDLSSPLCTFTFFCAECALGVLALGVVEPWDLGGMVDKLEWWNNPPINSSKLILPSPSASSLVNSCSNSYR